jgi:hypothetical protein
MEYHTSTVVRASVPECHPNGPALRVGALANTLPRVGAFSRALHPLVSRSQSRYRRSRWVGYKPIQRLNERLEREAEFIVVEAFIDPPCWFWPYLHLSQRGAEVALSRGQSSIRRSGSLTSRQRRSIRPAPACGNVTRELVHHPPGVENLHELPTSELITLYRGAASRHGEATLSPDPSPANSDADLIASVYGELRRRDERQALLPLLETAHPGVRSWAAAHAMEFAPAEGEPVLAELANDDTTGLIGFGAKWTLGTWRAGELLFP